MAQTRGMPRPADSGTTENFAGLLPRSAAYLIDSSIAFLLFASTQLLILTPIRSAIGIGTDWFLSGWNTQLYTLATVSIPVWLLFTLTESSRWKATPGKKLLKLEVNDIISNSRMTIPTALARNVVKLLPWELAHIGNNLPTPLWYLDEPEFRIFTAISVITLLVYAGFVTIRNDHRGPHDLISGTIVIHTAPSSTKTG